MNEWTKDGQSITMTVISNTLEPTYLYISIYLLSSVLSIPLHINWTPTLDPEKAESQTEW